MFNYENTEGFNAEEIALMNQAVEILMEQGIDEKSASDIVNNKFFAGCSLEDLTK